MMPAEKMVRLPAGIVRPMSPTARVNHTLPSGPAAMPPGPKVPEMEPPEVGGGSVMLRTSKALEAVVGVGDADGVLDEVLEADGEEDGGGLAPSELVIRCSQ